MLCKSCVITCEIEIQSNGKGGLSSDLGLCALRPIMRGLQHFTIIFYYFCVLRFKPYKFTIRYLPGKENITDYMSRYPIPMDIQEKSLSEEYVNFLTLESSPNAIGLDEVRETSMNEKTIHTAILYTRKGRLYHMKDTLSKSGVNLDELTAIRSVRDELTVHSDDVLLRSNRIVLPQTLRRRAVQVSHEGHQGMAKTEAYLRSKVWFPGMDGAVKKRC